ncbi:MAG: glycerol acyltransferase [Bacteroidetes bacterium GWF2_33_16]|nr:MAG: glycerol acyltransferase [Bacteroidetes bacterium GWE2_32_14]OFY07044.1 MAG: glycerol acyltransferase [Bacteroidetes bacterium GWF2_33_16]
MDRIKKNLFAEDIYLTKENSRCLLDKLSLNTKLYFVIKYLQILFRNRKVAKKGQYNRANWALSSYKVIKLIEDCGGQFEIEGINNLKSIKEPVVIVSNHMSAMESMIFPALIAPFMEVTFVVKESLARHFLFGVIMRARNPITVGRTNSREDLISVLNQGKEFLKNNTSVVIFPQGGRRDIFKPEEFNSLGVKLASMAGVKIFPIALKTDFWGNGKIMKDFGKINRKNKIHIKFGEPISIEGSGKEQQKKIIDFISENLETWNKE